MSSRPNTIAIVIGCAFFMGNLDSTIVTTALPLIAVSMDVDPVQLNVVLTGYFLSNAIFVPISAWLADRIGVRTTFQAAITLFALSSIFCALSNTVLELTAARVLQGAAGAMIVPVGRFALLRSVKKSELVSALAWLTVTTQTGSLIGPVLGGAIATYASWRWIFLFNLPLALLGLALAARFIENFREPKRRPLDWISFLMAGTALFCLLYALEAQGRETASAFEVIALLLVGSAAGWLTIWHLRRTPNPLVDLSVMRVPTFSATLWGGLLFRVGYGGLPFILPLLFQVVFGMDAVTSGILIFATAIGSILIRTVAPRILARVGFRPLLIWNGIIASLTMLAYGFFTATAPVYVLFGVLLIGGLFQALQITSLNAMTYADIENHQIGSATSIAQLTIRLGKAFGVSAAALFLHFSLSWRESSILSHADVLVAIIGITAISVAAMPFFLKLAPDAGAAVSGHSTTGNVGKGSHSRD